MIEDALQYLKQELGQPETIELDGTEYVSRDIFHPPDDKMPTPLTVNTLTGLADYLAGGTPLDDAWKDEDGTFIHVQDYNLVALQTQLSGKFAHQRACLIKAVSAYSGDFRFGMFVSIPQFIIGVQAEFGATDDRTRLLELVSNIKAEQSQAYLDNGFAQEVTAKRATGSSLSGTVPVPNPVTLKPHRTFCEIDQPESSFVFRLRSNENGPPECGLFEASGGAWKLEAIRRIKEWLVEQKLSLPIIA